MTEGSLAGTLNVMDHLSFELVSPLHRYRNQVWQDIGLAGTGWETASNVAAWVGREALYTAGMMKLLSLLRGSRYGLTRSELREVLSSWDKGTFESRAASIRYHFGEHGGGRSLLEYTRQAREFFIRNAGAAQWGQWNPTWAPSFRVIAEGWKGYFTAVGKILTYFSLD
jgi:hypothetical protein